jgi:replicative DNA helicase
MRLRHPHAELRAVATVLDGHGEISAKLLGLLREAHFGYGPTHEIYVAIRRHLTKRTRQETRLPSTRAFRYTPGLSDEARELLAKQPKPIKHAADIEALYQSLEFHRQLRVLHGFMADASKKLSGDAKRMDLLAVREQMIHAAETMVLRDESEVFTHLPGADAKAAVKDALAAVELIKSPFKGFNDNAGGFAFGDLHVLASHRSGGKSAMGNCLCDFFCQELHLPTAYVQLEMSRGTQVRRLLAKRAQVKHSALRDRDKRKHLTAEEKARIKAAYRELYHAAPDKRAYDIITPGNIGALQLELLLRPYEYKAILVDQLTMMDLNEGDNEAARLSNTAKALKQLARRLNAAVFLLVQLDMKEDQIRYSRGIEEHADLAWMWRWSKDEMEAGVTEVTQMKTRHFEPFPFTLKPVLDHMTFEDATSEDQLQVGDQQDLKKSMGDL